MSAVFVTATGTGIGKTLVAAGLLRHMRAAGHPVYALKPIISGFDERAWQNTDSAVLLVAAGLPVTLQEVERVSPWRFTAPLSPDTAARHEGRAIDFAQVVEFCREALQRHSGFLAIEGVGGIMVPLDERHTVLDWMSVLRIPLVLVTGTYVGTLSHTLTALEVLARRNLDVAAVAVSESAESAASLEETLVTLERFADSIDVIAIPRLQDTSCDHPAWHRLAEAIVPSFTK
jgi:dethiobiotin synthetase